MALYLTISLCCLSSPISGGSTPPLRLTKTESTALLQYARNCLLAALDGSSTPTPPNFAIKRQQACFVTFFHARKVVACFGGFIPRRASLAAEIAENIRLALTNDARSHMVSRKIAMSAEIQITFPVGQPELVNDYRSIDPSREGMFVEAGENGVAFVPGEARTANWAFREGLRRLGVRESSGIRIYRFAATAVTTRNFISDGLHQAH